MDSPLNFNVEGYQGPLDLLLDLIRKQEIDIYNIPIAKITAQYLDIIHSKPDLDVEAGGEFVLMAATLIHIKSRMLVPADPTIPPEEQVDPRMELVNQLLEHEKFIKAAQMLQQKQMLESASFSHYGTHPALGEFLDQSDEPGLAVTLFDLIDTFQKTLERAKTRPQLDISTEEVTVEAMMERVRDKLAETRGVILLSELFAVYLTRRALITLFLAILEMTRLHAVVLRQEKTFGDIQLRKGHKFQSLYTPGALESAMGALDENGPQPVQGTEEGEDQPSA